MGVIPGDVSMMLPNHLHHTYIPGVDPPRGCVLCKNRAEDAVDDLAENYQLLLPFQTVMLEISVFF